MSRSERSRHSRRGRTPREPTVASPPASAGEVAHARFEVRCACGVTMRGQRHADEHSVICSSCGTELPLEDCPGQAASVDRTAAADSQVRARGAKVAPPIATVETERNIGTAAADDSAGLHPERLEQRRHVTSLRILALAVLLLVSATAYWGWHQSRQQRFLLELQNATSQGEAALVAGDFARAVELLAEADRAARGLHSQDSQARLASQLYREALVWSKLAVEGVDEFFFVRAADAASGANRLIGEFDRELAGRSVIIQTHAIRIAPEDAPQDPQSAPAADANDAPANTKNGQSKPLPLALEWLIAGEKFRVEIDSRDLAQTSGVAAAGEQDIVFGAELRSVERDSRRPGGWLIRLVPESCVLLTAPGPFVSTNWPDREQLELLLAAQRAKVLPEPETAGKVGEAP